MAPGGSPAQGFARAERFVFGTQGVNVFNAHPHQDVRLLGLFRRDQPPFALKIGCEHRLQIGIQIRVPAADGHMQALARRDPRLGQGFGRGLERGVGSGPLAGKRICVLASRAAARRPAKEQQAEQCR